MNKREHKKIVSTVGDLNFILSSMPSDMKLSLNLEGNYGLEITSIDNLYEVSGGEVYECEIYFER